MPGGNSQTSIWESESIKLWNQFKDITLSEANKIYKRLGIDFDLTLGESFYHDQLGPLVEDLLAKGIAEISDDAVCIFSNKELDRKDDPLLVSRDGEWVPVPCMIRKNDGGYNYATTDITTIDYRVNELKNRTRYYI